MVVEAFDPASQILAPAFKTSPQEWTDAFAPELIVWLEELPAGLFLTGLGRVLIGLAFGIGSLAYVAMGNPTGRDREAAQHMAAHWLTHPNAPGLFGLASASAATPQAFASELQALRTGIAANNVDLVRAAFAFTPADVDAYFRTAYSQFQGLFAGAGVAPAALAPPTQAVPAPEAAIVSEVQSLVGYGEVF